MVRECSKRITGQWSQVDYFGKHTVTFPIGTRWIDFDQLLNKIVAVELKSISSGISKPAAVNDWMMFSS